MLFVKQHTSETQYVSIWDYKGLVGKTLPVLRDKRSFDAWQMRKPLERS